MLAQAASGAGEEELPLLQTLCEAARRRWEARLRPGMVPEDCGAAFTCAAAFTAAADLPGSRGGGARLRQGPDGGGRRRPGTGAAPDRGAADGPLCGGGGFLL